MAEVEEHGPSRGSEEHGGGGGLKGLTGKKLSLPLVGGIVVVGGIIAFVMMRSSSGGGVAQSAAQTAPNSNSDAASTGDISALNSEIQGLQANSNNQIGMLDQQFQQELAALQQGLQQPAATGAPSDKIDLSLFSAAPAGYSGDVYTGNAPFQEGGYTYYHLDNPAAATAYEAAGGVPYYFPTAGVAAPNPGPGTVQYGRVPTGNVTFLPSGPTANA